MQVKCQSPKAMSFLKTMKHFYLVQHIQPLLTSSTHINPDNIRTRKLLLNRREIDKLYGMVNQKVMRWLPYLVIGNMVG